MMTDASLPTMALSIRQPWAWAIMTLGKDIENREWATRFRGPVCIHASKGLTLDEYNGFIRTVHHVSLAHPFPSGETVPPMHQLPRGGIVGTAEVAGCVTTSASPWFFGTYGFLLRNIQPVDFIPCKARWDSSNGNEMRCCCDRQQADAADVTRRTCRHGLVAWTIQGRPLLRPDVR